MEKISRLLLFLLFVICIDGFRERGGDPRRSRSEDASRMRRHPSRRHLSSRYLCPGGGFVRLGNGCYRFSSTMANWQEAHFECNDLHPSSNLANLETAWEDKTIRTHLNKPEVASLERWIGGIFDWKRGEWMWGASGQPFSYQGFSRRSLSRPHWECTFMDPVRRYRWIHDSCLTRRHYICEAPLSRVTPTPLPIGGEHEQSRVARENRETPTK